MYKNKLQFYSSNFIHIFNYSVWLKPHSKIEPSTYEKVSVTNYEENRENNCDKFNINNR